MNTPVSPTHPPAAYRDPDEINLLEYAWVILRAKKWIAGLTLLGMVLGLTVAYVKGPKFEASVLIAPREAESAKTPNLSGLGALGGLVGAQLMLGTTPGLDRIETILKTRQFNAEVILQHGLLPDLYRVFWRKSYRKWWDHSAGNWKKDFPPPEMPGIGSYLANKVLKREIAKNNKNMTISLATPDSAFSYRLLDATVLYLNTYIRDRIEQEAGTNVRYLDSTLGVIADPLLREKVQSLIASEIEKRMVVSKEAFQVIDPVVVDRNFKHKKLYPVALGFAFFMMTMLWVVFAHAIAGAEKLPEDKQYLAGIREELRRWW